MIYLIKELVLAFKIANKIKNTDWDKEIGVLDYSLGLYGSEYWKCKVLCRVIDKNNPSNSLDFTGKDFVCYDRFGDYLIVNKMGDGYLNLLYGDFQDYVLCGMIVLNQKKI